MAYLFVHFTGESERGEQIYFSVSRDGLNWEDISDGPVLCSDVGERGIRDPFIIRNPLDNNYYIIATDLRIASGKGWDTAQFSGSTSMIMFRSPDLVSWSRARMIKPEGMDSIKAGCLWAPEAIYDSRRKCCFVYWASMIDRKQRIFGAWTEDFTEFQDMHQYIEKESHIIDTTMAEEKGIYYRFSACADYSGILVEKGKSCDAEQWEVLTPEGVKDSEVSEGPEIIYLRERSQWCLYADNIGRGCGYVPYVSDSLSDPQFLRLQDNEFDFGIRKKRHGSIIEITQEEYDRLKLFYR